jgi:hypothetical protein
VLLTTNRRSIALRRAEPAKEAGRAALLLLRQIEHDENDDHSLVVTRLLH